MLSILGTKTGSLQLIAKKDGPKIFGGLSNTNRSYREQSNPPVSDNLNAAMVFFKQYLLI